MRIDWRMAAGLLVIVGAVLGTALGITFAGASGGDAADQYEVTVRFNTSVTQGDIEETEALLRTFDDDLEFVVMEIFPPIGSAVMTADASDFCETMVADLEAKSYIDSASCGPWTGGGGGDGDDPVSTDNGTE